MNAPFDLHAAHTAFRDHAIWSARAASLSASLDDPRLAYARPSLARGLILALEHVAQLERLPRVAPPAEERRPNLNTYSMANAPTSYRSAAGRPE